MFSLVLHGFTISWRQISSFSSTTASYWLIVGAHRQKLIDGGVHRPVVAPEHRLDEPVGGGGRGKGGDLPPAYGEAMKNQGEHGRQFGDQADCGPFGPASSLGPDLL